MQTSDALEQLIKHRESQWNHHCQYVLQNFLLPAAQHIPLAPKGIDRQSILLIENRINDQWLFTVLNSWLMAPKDSSISTYLRQRFKTVCPQNPSRAGPQSTNHTYRRRRLIPSDRPKTSFKLQRDDETSHILGTDAKRKNIGNSD